jgi:hypothetical protein
MDATKTQLVADDYCVRKFNDVAEIMEPIKAIGNGQVPLAMAYAFSKLSEGIVK